MIQTVAQPAILFLQAPTRLPLVAAVVHHPELETVILQAPYLLLRLAVEKVKKVLWRFHLPHLSLLY
eukprot:COSAG02_NODE_4138_length_5725_cov_20.138287_5_plen_67_part_00